MDPPAKNYHSVSVALQYLGGQEISNAGPSARIGYLGEYGLTADGHLSFLLGIGVSRMNYRSAFTAS